MNHTDMTADNISSLARHLLTCQELVKTFTATPPEEEAWELAHTLSDVSESGERVTHELLPALRTAPPGDPEIVIVLHAIGEEYRHMLYHLLNTRYFSHIVASMTPGDGTG